MEDKPEIAFGSSFNKALLVPPLPKTLEKYAIKGVLKRKSEELRNKIQKDEIDISKEEDLLELIASAKKSLTSTYGKAGVKIEEKDFPKLYVLPEEKKEQLVGKAAVLTAVGGSFSAFGFFSVVFVGKKEPLYLKALKIHHELDHGIGRVALVIHQTGRVWSQEIGQVGFETVSRKGERRGKLLEEGVVQTNSENFVLNSNEPIIVKARKEMSGFHVGKLSAREALSYGFILNKNYEKLSCAEMIEQTAGEFYSLATDIIGRLGLGISLDEEYKRGQMDFETELLKARVDPKQRRHLMTRIDNVWGEGTTEMLFRVGGYISEAKSARDELIARAERF